MNVFLIHKSGDKSRASTIVNGVTQCTQEFTCERKLLKETASAAMAGFKVQLEFDCGRIIDLAAKIPASII